MRNTIYLVMGKSGAGKDTIVNELCNKYGMSRLSSYTTRSCRGPSDIHEFVDTYEGWLERNPDESVVAYSFFAGNHYWASQSQVEVSDLYVIDPDGVAYFRDHYNGTKTIRAILIDVPWYKRLARMLRRGDGFVSAVRRLVHDHRKFADAVHQADYIVKNNDLYECVLDVSALTGRWGGSK